MTDRLESSLGTVVERWAAFPEERKIDLLDNLSKLVVLERRKADLLDEMRGSLLNEWMKVLIGPRKDQDERWFLRFVRAYYDAKLHGRRAFTLAEREFTLPVAEQVIAWLEPYLLKMGDDTSSWRGSYNMLRGQLRVIRKNYEKQLEERNNVI